MTHAVQEQTPTVGVNRRRSGTAALGGLAAAVAVAVVALLPIAAQAQAQSPAYRGPRTPDRKPDLNGIWQVLNEAHFNVEPHSGQMGIPPGLGVVEGGEIPYTPEAAKKRKDNFDHRFAADPLNKCFVPGVPRVMYLPFPFEITQTPKHIAVTSAFHHTNRIIYTDGSPHPAPLEFWIGDSRGHWEGDALVVDVTHFNDQTWFDAAGNFHSEDLHVVERYTLLDRDHLNYDVTIEDPKVFTRPWKMHMVMYRRLDKNLQLLDYDCVEYFFVNYLNRLTGK